MRANVGIGIVAIGLALVIGVGIWPQPSGAGEVPPLVPIAEVTGGIAGDVAVQGDYAYIAAFAALVVVDVSLPSHPVIVGWAQTPGDASGVFVSGTTAYVADWNKGLQLVDISNPAYPAMLGRCQLATGGVARDLVVSAGYAYIAYDTAGLVIVDVSDTAHPTIVGQLDTPGAAMKVAVAGNRAYIADSTGYLRIADVTDKSNPTELTYQVTAGKAVDVTLAGNYAYVAAEQFGLKIIDISLSDPVTVGSIVVGGTTYGVTYAGGIAYLSTAVGLYCVDVSDPAAPVELGHLEIHGDLTDVTIYGSRAYTETGASGMHIIDISDPSSPAEIGLFNPPGGALGAIGRDGYVYVANFSGGVQVIDMNGAMPVLIDVLHADDLLYDVALRGDYLYSAGNPYFSIDDISDPHHPAPVGQVSAAGGHALALAGDYAYVACYSHGLRIVDVSDPAAPEVVSTTPTADYAMDIAVQGHYAYVAARNAGLLVFDVSNAAAPTLVGSYLPDPCYGITGLAVDRGRAYLANAHMLTIVDVSDPASPTLVSATNITYPAQDIEVYGRYAYVALKQIGMRVFDVTDPAAPVAVARSLMPGNAWRPRAYDGLIYLAVNYWGVYVFTPPPGTVIGQVRSAQTLTPLVGAAVSCSGPGFSKQATTDINGIYTMTGVPAGPHPVSAVTNGFVKQTKNFTVVAYQNNYVNFALRTSGRLSGQVRDAATSANLAFAPVTASLNGVVRATGLTAANGIYILETDLPTGTYVVAATRTGYKTQTKANISVTEGSTTYVNFNLKRVLLKGQVRAAATSSALAGATVAVYSGETVVTSTVTNASGVYEITDLPAGTYRVVAAKVTYVRQSKPNITTTDNSTTYVNFSLQTSGVLRGQVKDKVSSLPIAGATVEARLNGVLQATGASAGLYGIYEINTDLPAGTYTVTAGNAGYDDQVKTNISVTAGATTYVNFNLQPQ